MLAKFLTLKTARRSTVRCIVPFGGFLCFFFLASSSNSIADGAPNAGAGPSIDYKWKETVKLSKTTSTKYCSKINTALLESQVKNQDACFKQITKGKTTLPPLKSYHQRVVKMCDRSKKIFGEIDEIQGKIETTHRQVSEFQKAARKHTAESVEKDISALKKIERESFETLSSTHKELKLVNLHFKQLIGFPQKNAPGSKSNQYHEAFAKGRESIEAIAFQSKAISESKSPARNQLGSAQACVDLKKSLESREKELHKSLVLPLHQARQAILKMEPTLLQGAKSLANNSSIISDRESKLKKLGPGEAGAKANEKNPSGISQSYPPKELAKIKNEPASEVKGESAEFLEKEKKLGIVDRTNLPHVGAETANKEKEPIEAVIVHQTSELGVPFTAEQWIKAGNKPDPSRGNNVYGAHYYIDKDGTIEKARTLSERTNHIGVDDHHDPEFGLSNRNTIGIELVGKEEEEPTEAQYRSLKKLSAILNPELKKLNPEIIDSRAPWFNHSQISMEKHAEEGVDLRRIFNDIPKNFQGKGRTGISSPGEYIELKEEI